MPEFGISDEDRAKQRQNLAKRSAAGQADKYAQDNRASLAEAEKQLAPPVINEPRCRVCQSEHRLWIERQLLKGRSNSAIAKSLPPDNMGRVVDRRSIANHVDKHMPLDEAVTRAILQEEADLIGQNWEEGVRGAFTMRGSIEVLIRKAYEDALSGVTTVEPRDLIQMVKLYNDMNENSGTSATEEAKTAIRLFMEAIRTVLTQSDLVEPDTGIEIMKEIQGEVQRLRQQDEIEKQIEQHLALPATAVEDVTLPDPY